MSIFAPVRAPANRPTAPRTVKGATTYRAASAADAYIVIATKPNYVRTAWGEQRVEGPGKRITLADGQRLDNIDLRMTRAGVISRKDRRRVRRSGQRRVRQRDAVSACMQGSRRLMPSGRGGSTNDIGEFRVYGLSPGQHYVSATPGIRSSATTCERSNRDTPRRSIREPAA